MLTWKHFSVASVDERLRWAQQHPVATSVARGGSATGADGVLPDADGTERHTFGYQCLWRHQCRCVALWWYCACFEIDKKFSLWFYVCIGLLGYVIKTQPILNISIWYLVYLNNFILIKKCDGKALCQINGYWLLLMLVQDYRFIELCCKQALVLFICSFNF